MTFDNFFIQHLTKNIMTTATAQADALANTMAIDTKEVVTNPVTGIEGLENRPVDMGKVKQILHDYDLDWTVGCYPVKAFRPNPNYEKELQLFNAGKLEESPSKTFVLPTRSFAVTNDKTHEVFTTVSETYEPYQNYEVVELAQRFADWLDVPITSIKKLSTRHCKDAIINVNIESKEYPIPQGIMNRKRGDVIKEILTITNSHDKTKGFGVMLSHVVLSCTNGQTRTDRQGYIGFRHTKDMKRKLYEAVKGFDKLKKTSHGMLNMYERMASIEAKPEDVEKVLHIITGQTVKSAQEEISARASNIINEVRKSVVQEMSYKGGLYGLQQGVLHYTSHRARAKDDPTNEFRRGDAATKAKMFGLTNRREMEVWKYLEGQTRKRWKN